MMKWPLALGFAAPVMLLAGSYASPIWAQDFHTEPSCWAEPRLYHAGPPSDDLARKVERTPDVTREPRPDAVVSPNGAYKAWVEMPNAASGGLADQILYVSSEQGRVTRFYMEQAQLALSPRWINEKLVFLRVPWGRIVSTDLIIDAESGELIFNEEVRDGRIAFEQFQQACNRTCPCDMSGIADVAPPPSRPGKGEVIGHLRIDRLLNQDRPSAAAMPGMGAPAPLPVHVNVGGTMREIARIETADGLLTDGNEDWQAALVYDRKAGWYQIALSGAGERRVWVKASDVDGFTGMPELLRSGLAYLDEHWDGRVWASPDGVGGYQLSSLYDPGLARQEYAAEITEVRETDSGPWLKVAIHKTDDCLRNDSTLIEEGWVPAWSQDGQLVGGYYARGC